MNSNPQTESMFPSLVSQPPPTAAPAAIVTPQPTLEAANSLLTSLLANNMPRAPAAQQSTNPGTGAMNQLVECLLTDTTGQHDQQQQHAENILQAMPGIGNMSAIFASSANANVGNNNFHQGQNVTNTAKRPRLSLDNHNGGI